MLEYEVAVRNRLLKMKEQAGRAVHDFFVDEKGDTNLISIVIVLVIVLALAIIFRNNIAALVNGMWDKIAEDAGTATKSKITTQQFN